MAADGTEARTAFLSGPFSPDDLARLEATVERNLARHRDAATEDASASVVRWPEPPILDLARSPAALLDALRAPCFDATVGGPLARLVKRVLNVPLRLFGRPQAYFNAALREALDATDTTLRAVVEAERALRDVVATQAAELERLREENARLRTRPGDER